MSSYVDVLTIRSEKLRKIRSNPKLLAASKIYYKNNPVDFVNDWVFTYDPRQSPATMPFILFKRQQECIRFLLERWEKKESGLIEKSRDMGLTWLSMAFATWAWLFNDGVSISFGSRKEELVDKIGDPKCIFEKGRMILRYLPKEYLPVGFDVNKHCPHMKFINPQNGSTITGEAGDNMGRGGRSTIYFKDESAFYERPERIDAAISQNSDVKIDISTPNGEGNPFWRKRFSGVIPVFTFHWRDDPRKDNAWYEKQKREIGNDVIVAQEIDIDYSAAVENVVIPAKWVRSAVNLDLDEKGLVYAGLDVADEGGDLNVFILRKGVVVKDIQSWSQGNTTETARKSYAMCEENKVSFFAYDSIGVGAGVKGEMWSITRSRKNARLTISPFNAAASCTDDSYNDDQGNDDLFVNLKAEMWYKMRRRFERTYEKVNGIKDWPDSDLISIPNHSELISELSRPRYERGENGRIKIEPKKKMKARGVKSPNYADALIICFYNGHLGYNHWL